MERLVCADHRGGYFSGYKTGTLKNWEKLDKHGREKARVSAKNEKRF